MGDVHERIDTVVIGAGQAGLSVGYHLARRGQRFVILERRDRVGDCWRSRWDSLRLFTPARFDALDGMPFPGPRGGYPRKDEMAEYLEAYAARFKLPIRTGMVVTSLTRSGESYRVVAGGTTLMADQVVIAMSSYQVPRVPSFASALSSDIVQLHSHAYRNLSQLRPGSVLVVGAGNSGAEIALEAARSGRTTYLAGRDVGHVPFPIDSALTRTLVMPLLFRVVFHRVLSLATPMGRKVRPNVIHRGAPLIRVKPSTLRDAGVHRVGRVTGVRDGRPVLQSDEALDVANVVWCTGYEAGLSWIELPVFGDDGEPVHERGVVPGEPGLYFVGQHFLYSLSSAMVHGVGRDAAYVAATIARRTDRREVAPRPPAALSGSSRLSPAGPGSSRQRTAGR